MSREIVGMDLNGVWDHVATESGAKEGKQRRQERDEGPRSVVVCADRANGGGATLIGGLDAVSTIYGRGLEFGEKGDPARRRETADAWRELRGANKAEGTNESGDLLVRDVGNDGEWEMSAGEVLLAGARSAIGWHEETWSSTKNAGFCIPDDRETTETVQVDVLEALGRRALGGIEVHLVWDSVAVALAMLDETPALTKEESIGIVVSYGNDVRTHVFQLRKDGRTGRTLPVRKGPQDPRPWPTGWNCMREMVRVQITPWRDAEKVEQQTRAIEHWARGVTQDAWIRDEKDGWNRVAAPRNAIPAGAIPDATAGLENRRTVIAWSPVGERVTDAMVASLKNAGRKALAAPANAASRGALLAARAVERRETPWFDHLDGFWLTIIEGPKRTRRELPLIREDEVVRAGEPYRTPSEKAKEVSKGLKLEKGKSELVIPLRKGQMRGRERIEIETTARDHDVVIVAVQQPATGYARIEIGSPTYGPWSEEPKKVVFRPDAMDGMQIVPHLVRFDGAEEAWWANGKPTPEARTLEMLAVQCRQSLHDAVTRAERDRLYKWLSQPRGTPPVDQRYTVGTDGELPPPNDATGWTAERRMRAERDLDEVIMAGGYTLLDRYKAGSDGNVPLKALNQLHTVASWAFARCPNQLLDLLLDAVEGGQRARETVRYTTDGAHRAILQGLGRTVRDEESMRRAIRGALADRDGEFECDALACLSHLLARRRTAGEIVNRRAEWIEQIAERACDKMQEMAINPRMPDKWKMRPHVQMRYALLLLGGLARVKCMGNIALEEGTPVTRQITGTLELCEAQGTWSKGKMQQLGGIAGEVLAIYRGEEADPNLLYRMI